MKKYLLIPVLFLLSHVTYSQELVWDVACMETLILNHINQQIWFKKMRNAEIEITAIEEKIKNDMVQIEIYKTAFYKSLKSVSAIISQGKDIIYAGDIAADIGRYQKKMTQIVGQDPELAIVAAKTESQLVKRTADLTFYIYQVAIVGTDVNLMDNKQRLDLLKHVITELRIMRDLAKNVCMLLETAKQEGIIKSLFPEQYEFSRNTEADVDQILKSLH